MRWAPLVHLDGRVLRRLDGITAHHPTSRRFWLDVSTVLGPTVLRVTAAVLVVVLLLRRQPRPAAVLALTMVLAALLSTALKAAFDRPRPVPPVVLATAAGASFPSGHALTAAAFAGAVLAVAGSSRPVRRHLLAAAATVAALLVATVSLSRLFLAVHFVSDVVGGLLVGAAGALLVAHWVPAPTPQPSAGPQRLAFRRDIR